MPVVRLQHLKAFLTIYTFSGFQAFRRKPFADGVATINKFIFGLRRGMRFIDCFESLMPEAVPHAFINMRKAAVYSYISAIRLTLDKAAHTEYFHSPFSRKFFRKCRPVIFCSRIAESPASENLFASSTIFTSFLGSKIVFQQAGHIINAWGVRYCGYMAV